jgi:hypothetical protein
LNNNRRLERILKQNIVGHPGHCMREIVVDIVIMELKKGSLDISWRSLL